MAATKGRSKSATETRKHVKVISAARIDAGVVALGSRAALADWLGPARSQVTRAGKGASLGGDPGWLLTSLHAAVSALLTVYEPDAIPGWLTGFNPHLGDRRPLDVLAAGDVASVLAAIQTARTDSYA